MHLGHKSTDVFVDRIVFMKNFLLYKILAVLSNTYHGLLGMEICSLDIPSEQSSKISINIPGCSSFRL